jgi:AhpC/TSA family
MPSSRFRCPECDALIRPSRSDGKKVRCPECDALVRPPGDDVRSRRDDDDYDRPRRSRSGARRKPQTNNAALIAIPIVAFVLLIVGGAIVYAVYFMDTKTEPARPSGPAAGPVAKAGVGRPGGVNAGAAPRPTGPRVEGLQVGNLAPDIENEDLDGETFKLSDYRGKVVMLDFWGNW